MAGKRDWMQSRLTYIAPKSLILGWVCKDTKQAYAGLGTADLINAPSTLSVDIEGEIYVAIRAGAEGKMAGRLGLYSNKDTELWATDFIWIGQYLEGGVLTPDQLMSTANQNQLACQTRLTIIQSEVVYVGACLTADDPRGLETGPYSDSDGSFVPGNSDPTAEVWVQATDTIQLQTCGALPKKCPDTGPPYAWGEGDVVIWAAGNLALGANSGKTITINGDTPVFGVRVQSCMLQITHKPCASFGDWVDVANLRDCGGAGSCSTSGPLCDVRWNSDTKSLEKTYDAGTTWINIVTFSGVC